MPTLRIAFLVGLVCFGWSGAGDAQSLPKDPALIAASRPTAIKDVRLFDGERLVGRATVVFEKGKITAAGPSASVPPGAEVVDGSGKTLLPGLIDSHVHMFGADYLRQCPVFGVTAVVDMFMDVKTMKVMKADQAAGRSAALAFLVSPGTLATAPGGHGTQYGLGIPTLTGPGEAQAFVDARIGEGSDFVKIILDDGSAYGLRRPTLAMDTVAALIKAAHARGKMAVIHAATLKNCEDALNAGVDGLAHLFFDRASDPDFGRLAARQKAFVIPTLSVLQGFNGLAESKAILADESLAPYLRTFDRRSLEANFGLKVEAGAYTAAEAAVGQLRAAGVRILAGTDAPNPGTTYGASLHGEFELLVQAGLTPLEALKAATSVPADTFKIAGRGRVRPGYAADLLLVNGDPAKTITATRDIAAVWKDGARIDRDSYREATGRESGPSAGAGAKPAIPASGLISDFEGDKVASTFGAGWMVSTDTMARGTSKAAYRIVDGGANGSGKSLLVTGETVAGGLSVWAGAFFSPGSVMMAPADLSSRQAIAFWAKGEGVQFAVLVFSQRNGFVPASKSFTPGSQWQEFVLPFSDFRTNGSDIMGIFIGAAERPGKFALQLDDVYLK